MEALNLIQVVEIVRRLKALKPEQLNTYTQINTYLEALNRGIMQESKPTTYLHSMQSR